MLWHAYSSHRQPFLPLSFGVWGNGVCFDLIVTNNMELIDMLKQHHPMSHAHPEQKLQARRPGISPLGVLYSSKELRMRNPTD